MTPIAMGRGAGRPLEGHNQPEDGGHPGHRAPKCPPPPPELAAGGKETNVTRVALDGVCHGGRNQAIYIGNNASAIPGGHPI